MLKPMLYRLGLLKVTDGQLGHPGTAIVSFSKMGDPALQYSTVRVTLFGRSCTTTSMEYALGRWGAQNNYNLHTFTIHGRTFGFKKNLIKE